MTEPYVALTDYGLTLECLVFLFLLAPVKLFRGARFWFFVFFSSLAASSLIGGTVHGFFEQPSFFGNRILWPMTMLGIGVTAMAGAQAAKELLDPKVMSTSADLLIYGAFCAYCGVVLFINSTFLIAILGYLPALLILGFALIKNYLRTRSTPFLSGFLGLSVILFASAIQQAKILDASHRNVMYHLLQAVGLFMIFTTARATKESVRS
jgi:hypothetical protein